ncbi:MAG: hypothetical protein JW384_00599 [Nitrosomonadaceae bacterium]|nr:hypothetical protein [Nitrosomonadaceae bacterium]
MARLELEESIARLEQSIEKLSRAIQRIEGTVVPLAFLNYDDRDRELPMKEAVADERGARETFWYAHQLCEEQELRELQEHSRRKPAGNFLPSEELIGRLRDMIIAHLLLMAAEWNLNLISRTFIEYLSGKRNREEVAEKLDQLNGELKRITVPGTYGWEDSLLFSLDEESKSQVERLLSEHINNQRESWSRDRWPPKLKRLVESRESDRENGITARRSFGREIEDGFAP